MTHPLLRAYRATYIEDLLQIFPPAWSGLAARIIESGVELSPTIVPWAPRWSLVSPTVRTFKPGRDPSEISDDGERDATRYHNDLATAMKSVIYRVHDCLHQLWGMPTTTSFSDDDFYLFKRAVMCGEVAVLTLTEFVFCQHLWDAFPAMRNVLDSRNALPMKRACFQGLSTQEIAARLDGVLHKQVRPRWLRDSVNATLFANDYVPMLEADRADVDRHWALMKDANWIPEGAPNARYSQDMDGLELTTWMINDFHHLMRTDHYIDLGLTTFNRLRRQKIKLPEGW